MCEPLTIIQGVAGVLGVTTKLSISLGVWIAEVKAAPAEISALQSELSAVEVALRQLQKPFVEGSVNATPTPEWGEALRMSHDGAMETLLEVTTVVNKLKETPKDSFFGKNWKRTKYTYKEKDVVNMRLRLGAYKGNLTMMMVALNLNTGSAIETGVGNINDVLSRLVAEQIVNNNEPPPLNGKKSMGLPYPEDDFDRPPTYRPPSVFNMPTPIYPVAIDSDSKLFLLESLGIYRMLWDVETRIPSHCHLGQGELVDLIKKDGGEWWCVRKKDPRFPAEGYVPARSLELVASSKNPVAQSLRSTSTAAATQPPAKLTHSALPLNPMEDFHAMEHKSIQLAAQRPSPKTVKSDPTPQIVLPILNVPSSITNGPTLESLYYATCVYEGSKDGSRELSIEAGDRVKLISEGSDGWWQVSPVKSPRISGYVPAFVLSKCTEETESGHATRLADKNLRTLSSSNLIGRSQSLAVRHESGRLRPQKSFDGQRHAESPSRNQSQRDVSARRLSGSDWLTVVPGPQRASPSEGVHPVQWPSEALENRPPRDIPVVVSQSHYRVQPQEALSKIKTSTPTHSPATSPTVSPHSPHSPLTRIRSLHEVLPPAPPPPPMPDDDSTGVGSLCRQPSHQHQRHPSRSPSRTPTRSPVLDSVSEVETGDADTQSLEMTYFIPASARETYFKLNTDATRGSFLAISDAERFWKRQRSSGTKWILRATDSGEIIVMDPRVIRRTDNGKPAVRVFQG